MFRHYQQVALSYCKPTILFPIMGTALLCLFGSLGIRVAFNLSNADPSDIPGFIERLAGLFVIRGMENTESPLSLLAALTLAFSMIIPCTLGFHIRRRFAGSYAMVLPGFHRANIVVLISICVTCSLILALTTLPGGASLSGSFYTVSAFIMYTLCLVQFFSVGAIPITILTLTFFVGSRTAEQLFAESFSSHHLIALTIGIAATIVWGMRLSKLKPEYYDLRIVRLIPIAHNAAALKRLKHRTFQLGLARKLRNLGSYAGDSTWRKARLYSAGRYNLSFGLSVIICVLIVFAIALFAMDNRVIEIDSKTTHVLATGHVLFALLSGFCVLPFLVIASAPQNPLFNNLTKPCSRKQLIHEVGLSLIIDTLFVWLVLMLAWGAFTLLHTPQTFATSTPYLTALLSLTWMVWIFGTATWLLLLRPTLFRTTTLAYVILILVVGTLIAMLLSETNFFTAFSISASSVLFVLGVLTFLLGYRRLLKKEFGVTDNSSVFTLRSFLLALPYFIVFPLLVPIFGYLVTAGPTAPIPSESPLVKLNRLHEGMEDNAAELYLKAFSQLEGKSPKGDWTRQRWSPGNLLPVEVTEWVHDNEAALSTLHQATQRKNCWSELVPDESGFPELKEAEKMGTLLFLEYCQARVALEHKNWRELACILLRLDSMKRHLQQTPYLIPQLSSISAAARIQRVILAPFHWPELTPWENAEYAQLIITCFDEMPPLTESLQMDHEIILWHFISAPEERAQRLLLFPGPRLAAELEKYARPLWQLSKLPIEDQANQYHPLHEEVRRLQQEPVSKFNLVGHMAKELWYDSSRTLELRVRITTEVRGNRTVIALFAYRNRYGCFPESLDVIPGDFKIDPYSAKPFVYKKTDQGFLLYSVGVDRDDDGGTHHPKFGERKNLDPDGDYVIWPLPAGNIPDEDNAGRSTES